MIFHYKSQFDKAECIAVMSGLGRPSKNRKTGSIPQVWFLRWDTDPTVAVSTGLDYSVCGNCKQRWSRGGGCYVVPFMGPRQIWSGAHNSKYQPWHDLEGLTIRIGAYGDPASVPANLWNRYILPLQKKNIMLSYTHSWSSALHLRKSSQASIGSERDMRLAHLLGWKTTRIIPDTSSVRNNEILCKAQEQGKTCEQCMLCQGKHNICFISHGTKAERAISVWDQISY